jgi:hypothetical protein
MNLYINMNNSQTRSILKAEARAKWAREYGITMMKPLDRKKIKKDNKKSIITL